jgi:MerR family transcriptional regulator, mercuric resistance operon regulatory protein
MNAKLENLTIGGLANEAGINVETIRFYQRKGLMHQPDRLHGNVRRYGAAELGRVRFIKSAQRLGFSLNEIAQLLVLDDGMHCKEARRQAEDKLVDVQAKLADLHCIEAALAEMVARCHAATGQIRCPLIVAFQGGEPAVAAKAQSF